MTISRSKTSNESSVAWERAPQIELAPIGTLRSNPKNTKTHSKKQISQIAASMDKFGFLNPVIVDDQGTVLAGHGRLQAAVLNGLTSVPIIRFDHLTEAQKRAYLLADNKIAEQSGWDRQALAVEVCELIELLPQEGLDISLTGFEAPEIDGLIADMAPSAISPEDIPPPIPAAPTTQQGDLWILGSHRLLCGDAQQASAFSQLMNGVSASAIFCDPPYNLPMRAIGGRGQKRHAEFSFASGEMTPSQFRSFLLKTLGNGARVSADGAVHFVCMDWRHVADLIVVGTKIYDAMLNLVVWNKSNAGQGSFYRSQHELVGVFRIGDLPHRNNVRLGRFGRNRSNVWTYPGINTFAKGRLEALAAHPTVKPVALVADALLDCTAPGDAVLDQFCGSGTTILAAEKVGRRGFGIEYEPGYVDVTINRWQVATKRDAILTGDGRTFDEIRTVRFRLNHTATTTPLRKRT